MDNPRKMYRRWNLSEDAQQAYVPQDVLPQDDLVFFVRDVFQSTDLGPL